MVRHAVAAIAVFFFLAGVALAADKEVTCKVIKVDVKTNTLTVTTADGRKVYTVSDDTKFIGPKGGVSEEGIKDDRLVPGAQPAVRAHLTRPSAAQLMALERRTMAPLKTVAASEPTKKVL
jgi:hypothetical protein